MPSVALFGLLIAPLAALVGLSVAGNARHGRNRNDTRTYCAGALCLAAAGARRSSRLNQIPRDVLESARAMGMSGVQRFLHVQLPLALPVFLRSLRVVMVQTVGGDCGVNRRRRFGALVSRGC